jgi:hypothetical protein
MPPKEKKPGLGEPTMALRDGIPLRVRRPDADFHACGL